MILESVAALVLAVVALSVGIRIGQRVERGHWKRLARMPVRGQVVHLPGFDHGLFVLGDGLDNTTGRPIVAVARADRMNPDGTFPSGEDFPIDLDIFLAQAM